MHCDTRDVDPEISGARIDEVGEGIAFQASFEVMARAEATGAIYWRLLAAAEDLAMRFL
jgi:hypothetical protein